MVVACARSHVGFMQTFNHAMLAKQLWRITSNLNALLSRLLKQKYFPHSDVFQASAGTGCSFTWHSILTARDLFIPGLRWHIRTGQNVCIWKDGWIPRPWKFQVITAPNTLHPDATVDKLLDDSGGWNEALIQSVFRPEDTGLILGIGRSVGSLDHLYWHFEKHRHYSVRRAYRIIGEGVVPHLRIAPAGLKSYKSKG
ncbi:UNVERIFIED_CONTAM: hypothetical protein Sradi_6139700 [Sesamum radiatum]|uniref:Uncharacterized protein n=1 Tax=Sesamum radiatum TaxID=300843 RepID=A0AAW2KLM6_SESRA